MTTIKTRSSRYWDKRAIERLSEAEANSAWHFGEIQLLYDEAEKQKESLERIENILNTILSDLKMNYKKIA